MQKNVHTRSMKICHVTNYLPGYHTHSGGAEQACLRVAKAAEQKGASESFLTLPFDRKDAAAKTGGIEVTPVATIESFAGPFRKYIEILKWYIFQFDPLAYFSALKYFKQRRPDVVHLHNFQFLTFAVVSAAERCGIPVCLSIYDYWYFCPATTLFNSEGSTCREFHGAACARCLPPVMRPVQSALLFFRKRIFDFFFRKISVFIVLSNSSREILKSYGIVEEKIFVVPLPPAPGFGDLQDKTDKNAPAVLFMGWLQKRKGLDVLLKAMSEVWKEFPQARLKMIVQEVKWEQEYGKRVAEMLKSLPAEKYEFSSGQKSFEEIKSAISAASVIVIPEQWENMSPLLVIEAMQAGKAVVASRLGGIPEFIKDGETGFLADHSSPVEFAGKIKIILKDSELAHSIAERARESIKKFYDSADIPEKLMNVYQSTNLSEQKGGIFR